MNLHDEIEVCADCLMFLANGEVPEDDTREKALIEGLQRNWGSKSAHGPGCHVLATSENRGLSWRRCEGCGDIRGGNRHKAVVLCDHEECKD